MRFALCLFICLAGIAASAQEPKLVCVLRGHKFSVRVLAFSPDSKLLASSQDGGDVRLWDVGSGKSLSVLHEGGNSYGSLAFSPDGKLLAGGSDCRWVSLWDVANRTQIGTVKAPFRFPMSRPAVAFQPDGKTLVWRSCSSDDNDSDRQEIAFTNVAMLKNAGKVKVNIGRYLYMAFSPDCRHFAVGNRVGGDRDVIALYETGTGKKIATFKDGDSAVDLMFCLSSNRSFPVLELA
jgi:WD40 repeat protein